MVLASEQPWAASPMQFGKLGLLDDGRQVAAKRAVRVRRWPLKGDLDRLRIDGFDIGHASKDLRRGAAGRRVRRSTAR